jgi:hypothetical protein
MIVYILDMRLQRCAVVLVNPRSFQLHQKVVFCITSGTRNSPFFPPHENEEYETVDWHRPPSFDAE